MSLSQYSASVQRMMEIQKHHDIVTQKMVWSYMSKEVTFMQEHTSEKLIQHKLKDALPVSLEQHYLHLTFSPYVSESYSRKYELLPFI